MDEKETEDSGSIMETTVNHDRAIEVLIAGGTHDEAAAAAGVTHVVTVTRWANGHPGFQAALNRRRSELVAEQIDRVRRIDGLALGLVMADLENGDGEVAMQWIKARGLSQIDTSAVGPTDPDAVVEERTVKRAAEVQAERRGHGHGRDAGAQLIRLGRRPRNSARHDQARDHKRVEDAPDLRRMDTVQR